MRVVERPLQQHVERVSLFPIHFSKADHEKLGDSARQSIPKIFLQVQIHFL